MLNKVLIAAGGTGGHINPALGVAGYIKEKNPSAEIVFVGTKDKMEARLVPQAGFDIRFIDISGFYRRFDLESIKHNISTLSKLLRSSSQAKKIIKDFQPDIVIGFGGYVSGPVLRMAAKMKIPTAIHEQNAFPGVTNKALAGKVDAVMLTSEKAEQYMKCKNKPVITGLPVRGDLIKADAEKAAKELNLNGRPLVLSMGGSLGAKPVNDAVFTMLCNKYKDKNIVFMHATGKNGGDFIERLKEKGIDPMSDNIRVTEYIDIPKCLPAASLVISRSGASTLSELQMLSKPSILIPSPYVAENHQYHNAMALVENGAAEIIEEKALTGDLLTERVEAMLGDSAALQKMGENAGKMAVRNSTELIYNALPIR